MSERILIVDDEVEIADLIELYLKNENYIVFKFYNAEDALQCINTTELDLAILDIMLPDINGFVLCQRIRDKFNYPVIMLTAKDEETDKITGLTLGADDYITKPFNIKEVILRINNLIKRSYDDPSKIKMDGYDIDLEKRRVFNGGEEVILTTKEYDLLVYFITNKGLAISREQVLNKVWDENYYGSDRVVDDTLRRLRKKMPEINVRTIYGFGYRLD